MKNVQHSTSCSWRATFASWDSSYTFSSQGSSSPSSLSICCSTWSPSCNTLHHPSVPRLPCRHCCRQSPHQSGKCELCHSTSSASLHCGSATPWGPRGSPRCHTSPRCPRCPAISCPWIPATTWLPSSISPLPRLPTSLSVSSSTWGSSSCPAPALQLPSTCCSYPAFSSQGQRQVTS